MTIYALIKLGMFFVMTSMTFGVFVIAVQCRKTPRHERHLEDATMVMLSVVFVVCFAVTTVINGIQS